MRPLCFKISGVRATQHDNTHPRRSRGTARTALILCLLPVASILACNTDGMYPIVAGDSRSTDSATDRTDTASTDIQEPSSDATNIIDTDTEIDSSSAVSDATETIHLQAEAYSSLSDIVNNHSWQLVSVNLNVDTEIPDADPSHAEDAAGGAYMEALPDIRVLDGDTDTTGIIETPNDAPTILYDITFPTTGRYYVWVRAYSSGGRDNTMHVGIDGTWPASGALLQIPGATDCWLWRSHQRYAGEDIFGSPNTIYLDINEVGHHTITFAMREDGFEFDELVLTTDASLVPGNMSCY